ncbi:MAG: polyphosphate kinase 2 [Bacteroidetes bacterium GWC2_33_15]|nr:MAG: polyphosphate kinase 2 [Bacteroidetes bacterium GWA2_33_15]OFX51140.1 MAG: polyphosphate kinase 2 [Bacteroidetes bacterium GWC2_33_15]OFX66427.1 MAG: polyphosphate kinase 2 [Bacteroidetes bacterium GWB2_32_14]OFX70348.1 MAG: polyphosphate kinase 2 [Bacteroidetes bacterium GWD2_33_33]HAN17351.1 polyphosphate kinase 2 [Bacteroidales bacterium]
MELHSLETNPEYINLQTEMIWMQRWIMETQQRLVIIFEGRDTAGKGGAIMRFVRFINPRGYRIVALPKPTEHEKGQWYFQRYIKVLPDPGEIVFFDRSWYNRAVVEPVMGFCTDEQYQLFMKQVVSLEKMLIEDGIKIIKFWFSIDVEEQKHRLEERKSDPLKQWKLSTIDLLAQLKWNNYTEHKDEMFRRTGRKNCPWVIVRGKDRDKARLEAMRYVLNEMDYPDKGKTGERIEPDKKIVKIKFY